MILGKIDMIKYAKKFYFFDVSKFNKKLRSIKAVKIFAKL